MNNHPGYSDKASTETILSLLNRDDVTIYESHESENDYGEFLFITYKLGDAWWTSFGLGYNWNRERTVLGWESYTTSNWRKITKPLNKETVIAQIVTRHEEKQADFMAEQSKPQSRHGILYSMLADLTDEDGAMAEMQDLNVDEFFGDLE
jgi:hypothetical protein